MVIFTVYPYPTKLFLFALGQYCYILGLTEEFNKRLVWRTTDMILTAYNAVDHVYRVTGAIEEFVSQDSSLPF
jgi:hypothetical protein